MWPFKSKKLICEYKEIGLEIPYHQWGPTLGDIFIHSATKERYFCSGYHVRTNGDNAVPEYMIIEITKI